MFTTRQLQQIAQVNIAHLDQWRSAGILDARSDRWTVDDLYIVISVADLIARGATVEAAARFAAWMRLETAAIGDVYVDGAGFVVRDIIDAAWIVNLDGLRGEADIRAAAVPCQT